MHSARWDRSHQFAGERVAVIGTGASAVQIVPSIQPEVARLTRLPTDPGMGAPPLRPTVLEVGAPAPPAVPACSGLLRAVTYWQRELVLVPAFTKYDGIRAALERQVRRHLARQVTDPELRAKLTPHYQLGCKRVLPSNDFYPALTRHNVELVTEPIVPDRPRRAS